jgi:hypothetical protein
MKEPWKISLMYVWRESRSFFCLYLIFLLTSLVFMRDLEGPYVFHYWTGLLLMFPIAVLRTLWAFVRKLHELRNGSPE